MRKYCLNIAFYIQQVAVFRRLGLIKIKEEYTTTGRFFLCLTSASDRMHKAGGELSVEVFASICI